MASRCSRIYTCPLFRTFSIESSLKVWKTYYCETDFERCARWRLVQTGKQVPLNLLPNGRKLYVPVDELGAKHSG